MDIISVIHKSAELIFQIFGLVEVWTHRSMEQRLFLNNALSIHTINSPSQSRETVPLNLKFMI
jgi:hypothetical protein